MNYKEAYTLYKQANQAYQGAPGATPVPRSSVPAPSSEYNHRLVGLGLGTIGGFLEAARARRKQQAKQNQGPVEQIKRTLPN